MNDFLTPGIHRISADAYHGDPMKRPSLSSTLARLLLNNSPLHAWTAHPRLNPYHVSRDSKTFDIGRAAHRAVLGKGDDYVAFPAEVLGVNGAASTKAAKEWEAEQRAAGRTPLKAAEAEAVATIAEAVRTKLAAMRIAIDPEDSEVVALAEIEGVNVRAMIDNAPRRKPYLLDLKTTRDASPDACIKAVTTYGLDVQAAHYLSIWEAVTGERRKMRFVFVEKEPPFEVSVVELYASPGDEADWMQDAYQKVAEARRQWGECLAADSWPGYPAGVAVIGAPSYYRKKWEDYGVETPPVSPNPSPETLAAAARWQSPEGMSA